MQTQTLSAVRPRRRAILLRPLATLAVAVCIFALTAGNLSMLRRQETSFQEATQIQKALRLIKTAQWTRTHIMYMSDGTSKTVYEFAGRMNPPAFVYRARDSEGATIHSYAQDRLETLDGSIDHIFSTDQTPNYMPKRDTLKKFPPSSAAARNIREHIVVWLMFSPVPTPMPNQTRSEWLKTRRDWVNRRVQRDGRSLLEFRCDSKGTRSRIVEVADVDPATYRIVRTERQQYDARDGRLESEIIQDNFRYDEDIPDSTFQINE